MKTLPEARTLAQLMIKIGESHGCRVAAVLSDMDAPLGYNIGNLVEVREVVMLLQNNPWAESRLKALVLLLSGAGFLLAGRVCTLEEGKLLAEEQIISGAAFKKLCQIVEYQGGSTNYLHHLLQAPSARVKWDIKAASSGYIQKVDAEAIGLAAMSLGAGRAHKEGRIDPAAGIVLRETVGKFIAEGSAIATLYTASEITAREVAPQVWEAFILGPEPPQPKSIIYEIIGLEPL